MGKYYILADLRREATGEEKSIPAGGKMYAGKVKTIITADTWREAMESGKRCITGSLKNGITPFNWSFNEVDFVIKNGEKEIYDKYQTVTWVTYYRIKAKMTQKQVADAAGVNIRLIQKVEGGEAEAGNLTAKNLLAIADALGVDPNDLI